jgi:hypothetical protein
VAGPGIKWGRVQVASENGKDPQRAVEPMMMMIMIVITMMTIMAVMMMTMNSLHSAAIRS